MAQWVIQHNGLLGTVLLDALEQHFSFLLTAVLHYSFFLQSNVALFLFNSYFFLLLPDDRLYVAPFPCDLSAKHTPTYSDAILWVCSHPTQQVFLPTVTNISFFTKQESICSLSAVWLYRWRALRSGWAGDFQIKSGEFPSETHGSFLASPDESHRGSWVDWALSERRKETHKWNRFKNLDPALSALKVYTLSV